MKTFNFNDYLKNNPLMRENADIEEEGIDLFETPELIPPQVAEILDKYSDAFEEGDYRGLEMALKEIESVGYTFEYYLDGQPYDLRKIGQKGKSEGL